MLTHVGDNEILLDDAKRLASRAEDSGVNVQLDIWRDQIHVFHAPGPFSPVARQALDVVAGFVTAGGRGAGTGLSHVRNASALFGV